MKECLIHYTGLILNNSLRLQLIGNWASKRLWVAFHIVTHDLFVNAKHRLTIHRVYHYTCMVFPLNANVLTSIFIKKLFLEHGTVNSHYLEMVNLQIFNNINVTIDEVLITGNQNKVTYNYYRYLSLSIINN